ncbi:hypothetical protein [Nannocystis pusilla]|uniref:hypothetical protein n=1 Tax=Nannocystis pusilla TaxID=889268 RepID=UPI003B824876
MVAPQAGTVGAALRQMRYNPDVAVPNLVAWLGKLPKTSKSFWNSKSLSSSLLPDWDVTMQELAAQALLRDPSGFVAAAGKWKQANLRLGAHFLLGVSGHPVPAEIAADVLRTIAAIEAGTPPFRPQFFFVKNGALASWNLNTRDDARAVALHFGDAAAWDTALATAMLGGKWSRVRDVPVAVLAGLPLDAFMTILLAENRNPGDDPEALFAVLDARRDELDGVADAARGLASETGAQRLLREVLLVWTLQRGLDRGVAPTEAQVRELRDIGQPQVYAASEPDVQGRCARPTTRSSRRCRGRSPWPSPPIASIAASTASSPSSARTSTRRCCSGPSPARARRRLSPSAPAPCRPSSRRCCRRRRCGRSSGPAAASS